MAKAVTLKDQTNTEIYPVTDMSLVNGTATTAKIANEAITAAKIANGVITNAKIADATIAVAKLAGKAKINKVDGSGAFTAADRGVLLVAVQFQNYNANADCTATLGFSGASGTTVTPVASQRSSIQYTRSYAYGLALVDAGDSVSWSTTYSNAGPISNNSFYMFIPCNW